MFKTVSANFKFYVFLLAANIALVWYLPYFPTQDGPCHIYNLVILHDLVNGGKDWGAFFTYNLQAAPDLGFHLIAYPLLHFFPPFTVEKIFVSLYILLMGVSVPVFLRTYNGEVFPFAYFVFPVLFNYCLMMGFYSYVITVPLFLLAVSSSWRIQNKSVLYRIFHFNLMGIILFYFHLIPAVLYMMALGIMEIVRPSLLKIKIRNMAILVAVLLPSIINIIFYMQRDSFLSSHQKAFSNVSGKVLLRDLLSFSTVTFAPLQEAVGLIVLLFCFASFFYTFLNMTVKNVYMKRISLRDMPTREKFLLCFVPALILIYFSMPFSFGEASYFNQRFPWVIFLLSLPLLRCPEKILSPRIWSTVIASVAVLFLFLNVIVMYQQNLIIGEFVDGSSTSIPKGSFIMLCRSKYPDWSRIDVLLHATSYYGVRKKCVDLGNYEVNFDIFPVKYKRQMPSIPPLIKVDYEPETIRWEKYPAIQYILGWKVNAECSRKLAGYFRLMREKGPFSFWVRN